MFKGKTVEFINLYQTRLLTQQKIIIIHIFKNFRHILHLIFMKRI
jgi:hypothetical protein